MKAPKKIYISTNSQDGTYYISNQYKRLIEYVRTDAFIEKATLWMEENLERHISSDGEYTINYAEISRDFKTYIKNENSN